MMNLNKRIILTAVIALAGGVISTLLIQQYLLPPKIETILLQLSNNFNGKCPVMVDKITRFDNTSVGNNELRFNYTILTAVKDSVDSTELHSHLEPIVRLLNSNKPFKPLPSSPTHKPACRRNKKAASPSGPKTGRLFYCIKPSHDSVISPCSNQTTHQFNEYILLIC
jgi:hypothetical protein